MVRRRPAPPGPTRLRSVRTAGFTLTEGIHAGGSRLTWHYHEGPTLCFVLRGVFTETSGGERLTCSPDTLKVMPAGERHCDDFDQGDARGLLVEADPERASAIRTHAPVLDERVSFHGGLPAALARRVYQEFRQADAIKAFVHEQRHGCIDNALANVGVIGRSHVAQDRTN